MYNLNKFLSDIKTNGVAKNNLFDMFFTVPTVLGFNSFTDRLNLRCYSSALPGISISTEERKTFGPTRKIPYTTLFEDITFNFICSEDMVERQIFDEWINFITSQNSSFEMEYYDSYVTDLVLNHFNEKNQKIYGYKFYESYPINIGEQSLSWIEENTFLTLPVTFTFRYWKYEKFSSGSR